MDLGKEPVYKAFSATIDTVQKYPLRLLIVMLADMVFLTAFIFVLLWLGEMMVNVMYQFVNYMSTLDLSAAFSGTESMLDVLESTPLFKSYYYSFLKYAFLMLLSSFIILCIFQGFSWWFSDNIARKKKFTGYLNYLKKFSVVSLMWYVLYGIAMYIWMKFVFHNYFETLNQLNQDSANLVLNIVLGILVLLSILSYTLISKYPTLKVVPKTFLLFKKFRQIIPSLVVLFVVFLFVNMLSKLIAPYGLYPSGILFILVTMPLIVMARMFLLKAVKYSL